MQCYVCESQPRPTAALMRVVSHPAVGVCHDCGIGLCMRHARRPDAPGLPLRCEACARLAAERDAAPRERELVGAW